jgi:hypothetical protein
MRSFEHPMEKLRRKEHDPGAPIAEADAMAVRTMISALSDRLE